MTSRREFLVRASAGLAVAGGAGELLLRADAAPTRAASLDVPAAPLAPTRPVVHRPLTSEMYFEGDPRQDTDFLFHPSLCVPVERRSAGGHGYEAAVFDIVLEGKA